MIASLNQSGSVALAIFFTLRSPSSFDATFRVPFRERQGRFGTRDFVLCGDLRGYLRQKEPVWSLAGCVFQRKYSKSVSTSIRRWILRTCPDNREGCNST